MPVCNKIHTSLKASIDIEPSIVPFVERVVLSELQVFRGLSTSDMSLRYTGLFFFIIIIFLTLDRWYCPVLKVSLPCMPCFCVNQLWNWLYCYIVVGTVKNQTVPKVCHAFNSLLGEFVSRKTCGTHSRTIATSTVVYCSNFNLWVKCGSYL